MHVPISVTCPYCNTDQAVWVIVKHKGNNGKVIVSCDNEEVGGCDNEFIVEPIITATANVMTIVPVEGKQHAKPSDEG